MTHIFENDTLYYHYIVDAMLKKEDEPYRFEIVVISQSKVNGTLRRATPVKTRTDMSEEDMLAIWKSKNTELKYVGSR